MQVTSRQSPVARRETEATRIHCRLLDFPFLFSLFSFLLHPAFPRVSQIRTHYRSCLHQNPLQPPTLWPDTTGMDALTASAINAAKTQSEISNTVAAKSQSIEKQQGEAAVAMIAQAAKIGQGNVSGERADIYA